MITDIHLFFYYLCRCNEDNLRWRQEYAPPILREIREKLDRCLSLPQEKLPPKDDLYKAIIWIANGRLWKAFSLVVTLPWTTISVSSRTGMSQSQGATPCFFITNESAEREAMFYSLTLSCLLNGIDTSEYFADVIDKVARMKPKTPIEQYRDLLPDKWKKKN